MNYTSSRKGGKGCCLIGIANQVDVGVAFVEVDFPVPEDLESKSQVEPALFELGMDEASGRAEGFGLLAEEADEVGADFLAAVGLSHGYPPDLVLRWVDLGEPAGGDGGGVEIEDEGNGGFVEFVEFVLVALFLAKDFLADEAGVARRAMAEDGFDHAKYCTRPSYFFLRYRLERHSSLEEGRGKETDFLADFAIHVYIISRADLAQLVEQSLRKREVGGPSPLVGTSCE